jgi:hypothetical protein
VHRGYLSFGCLAGEKIGSERSVHETNNYTLERVLDFWL